jgi:hypothetical protein
LRHSEIGRPQTICVVAVAAAGVVVVWNQACLTFEVGLRLGTELSIAPDLSMSFIDEEQQFRN